MAEQPNLDALRTYIDGKLKRLNLLFAVNGGAFAIAKLSLESKNSLLIPTGYLAVGAILFTIIMVCDTWLWARMMKRNCVHEYGFTVWGKCILASLGLLMVAAWSYAGLQNWGLRVFLICAAAGVIAVVYDSLKDREIAKKRIGTQL